MKSSSLTRAFELAKLAALVGLKEFKSGDLNSRLEQAALIAKSLSNLKGAAMKAGQLLSLDLDNYFPPEAIEVLSQLHNAATAHPIEEIEATIASQISPEQRGLIQDLGREPIGVASIGQVHRARYNDLEIVLKVQFASISGSVDSDLKILQTLASSFCQITGRKMDLGPLFQEFRSILTQELDYRSEAHFQKMFYDKIAQLNQASHCTYRVPRVIEELTGEKLLAMTYEPGVTLRQWLKTQPSREQRDRIGRAILDLYFHEFFEWGMVQTDPNLGNFLIDTADSQPSLVLLDFGATRTYSKEFIERYIALLQFSASGKKQELRHLAIDWGIIDARESEAAFEAFEAMIQTAIKPFFVTKSGSPYFDFADKGHALESQAGAKALSQALVYSPPPYLIIFLHRKLAGIYSILKSLEVRLDISPYWQMMTDLSRKRGL